MKQRQEILWGSHAHVRRVKNRTISYDVIYEAPKYNRIPSARVLICQRSRKLISPCTFNQRLLTSSSTGQISHICESLVNVSAYPLGSVCPACMIGYDDTVRSPFQTV